MKKKPPIAKKPALLTAAQIKGSADEPRQRGTPIGKLHDIGREIRARIERLNVLGGKTVDMKDSIDHLLADAEKPCDRKGFEAFKKYYCQGLSQSWTYELLAVQEGRKTLEEIRAATRQRVAKHRAAKRECNGIDSVTADEDPAASVAEPPAIRLNGGQVIDVEKLSPAAQAQLAEMLPAATTDTSADADDDDHYTGLRYLFEEVIGSFGAGMEGFDAISDEPAKMFCGLELSDDLCHFDSRLTTGAVRAHVQAARRSHHRSGYHTATARS